MKRFLQFLVQKEEVGSDAFRRAASVVASTDRVALWLRLPDNSAQCADLLQVLKESGCRLRKNHEPAQPGTFLCFPNYEYEPADLDRADYFTITPSTGIHVSKGRDEAGTLMLPRPKSNWKSPLLAVTHGHIVASSSFRSVIEQAKLVGAAFGPTRLMAGATWRERKYIDWADLGWAPYWELTSNLILPPLSRRCVLRDNNGTPATSEGWSNGLFIDEGEFPAWELHYLRDAIRALEPFDFGRTFEAFGSRPTLVDSRMLVVSKRTRELVISHGISALWIPVVLDEVS